jgi:uncharacterized membrane protein YjjP (DUF1212 family)
MTKTEIIRVRRFVIKLGKTMHEYGTPTHRLENVLVETTRQLGLQGSFLVSPTAMNFVFWEPGSDEEFTHIARVNPGGIDLSRLAHTHNLAEQVLAGTVSLDEGLEQLSMIRSMPDPYPRWLEFIAWGTTSAGFAALCGVGLYDIAASLLSGWLVFGLVTLAARSLRVEEMLEPLSALLIALLVSGVAALGLKLNVPIIVLSGIIAFIPGLSLTTGLRELAARQLISGTARIMDSTMMLFKLYFGTLFGLAIGGLLWGTTEFTAEAVVQQSWVHYVAVLILSTSLLVIFKMRRRDILWGLLAGCIAYLGAEFGQHLFGDGLNGFIGALIVGLYANSFSRIKNVPSNLVLLPGIVLLVPGSKTYIGLNSLISGQNMLAGASSGAQVFLSFMAIIAGLIFANVILPPRQRA